MKKVIKVAILFVLVAILGVSTVKATTADTLADELYSIGSAYGLTSSDKVKIERYLADNTVTDAQANTVVSKANAAVAVMKAEGVTDYKKLSSDKKAQMVTLAKEAASTLGLTLEFGTGSVSIYKDGKLIETVTNSNGKLAYTGNSSNMIVVVSSIAVIALTAIIAKKRLANAQ